MADLYICWLCRDRRPFNKKWPKTKGTCTACNPVVTPKKGKKK